MSVHAYVLVFVEAGLIWGDEQVNLHAFLVTACFSSCVAFVECLVP